MGTSGLSVDQAHLARFSPLDALHPDLLEELHGYVRIERFPPGKCLLNREARRSEAMFLLSGQLALVIDGQGTMTLRADSTEARHPVAHQAIAAVTALARTSVTVLFVDTAMLEGLLRRSGVEPFGQAARTELPAAGDAPGHAAAAFDLEPDLGAVLLDVRSPGAFARRHLEGSVNLPRACCAMPPSCSIAHVPTSSAATTAAPAQP